MSPMDELPQPKARADGRSRLPGPLQSEWLSLRRKTNKKHRPPPADPAKLAESARAAQQVLLERLRSVASASALSAVQPPPPPTERPRSAPAQRSRDARQLQASLDAQMGSAVEAARRNGEGAAHQRRLEEARGQRLRTCTPCTCSCASSLMCIPRAQAERQHTAQLVVSKLT